MAGFGPEGEPPRDARIPDYSGRPPDAQPQQGRSGDAPLAPIHREQQGWQEQPHEELVEDIRNYIRWVQAEPGRGQTDPRGIIHEELAWQSSMKVDPQANEIATKVWWPISKAWDIIAYEYYSPGSLNEWDTGLFLEDHYQRTHDPIIRLSEAQARVIDALAEAVDIPHRKGQREFVIPEKLRNYQTYVETEEYEARLRQAREAWQRPE